MENPTEFDDTDRALLRHLDTDPRQPAAAVAALLGMARRTVQLRLDRAQRTLRPHSVRISPDSLGYPTRAMILISLAQDRLESVVPLLAEIPEITSCDAVSGNADLVCHVVARDNNHVYAIGQQILSTPGVQRTSTSIVLRQHIDHRIAQLLHPQKSQM